MTSSLLSTDREVHMAQRLWNLHQVVPNGQLMRGVTGAYVYSIDKRVMGSHCSSFDEMDKTSSIAVSTGALLQLVMRTTRQIAENMGKERVGFSDSNGRSTYPVQVFLESIVESEESATASNKVTGANGVREKILQQAYGIDVSGGELNRMDKSMSAITAEIPFLSHHRNRNVVGYRLWVFVFNSSIEFPTVMDAVMKLANVEFVKRTSSTTLLVDNEKRRDYLRSLTQNGSSAREGSIAAGIAAGGQFTMAHIVTKLEQWVLCYSREMFLNMISVYLSDTRYMTPRIRNECAAKELSHKDNPAFIGGVFGVPAMFTRNIEHAERKQMHMQNYFCPSGQMTADGTAAVEDTWMFPIPSAVLVVLPEMQTEQLCVKYLPDFQVMQVYTQLQIDDLNEVQSRTTDNETFGTRSNRRRGRASGVASASGVAGAASESGVVAPAAPGAATPRLVGTTSSASAALVTARRDETFDNAFERPYQDGDDDDDDGATTLPPDEFNNFRKGAKRSRTLDSTHAHHRRSASRGGAPRADDEGSSDTDDEAMAQGDNPFRRNQLLDLQDASSRAANDNLDPEERSNAVIDIARSRFQMQNFETQTTIDTNDRGRFADVILAQSNIRPPTVLAQQKKIDDSLNGQFGGNTLVDTLARSTRAELKRCMAIEDKQKRDCARTIIQNRAFQRYADTATNPLSDISESGCTINAFSQRAKALKEDHCTPALQFDKELSTFAHMMIQENTELDVLCGAHMCHRQLILMQAVHFDCYRPTFDLHLNMINYAGPGRSKSFTLLVHEERAIPNTCKNISRLTAKALSSGRDVIDEFQMFHEIPRELIVDPMENPIAGKQTMRGGEQSQIDIFKTSLTEQVVITQENAKVDGVFTTVERKSVQHKTFAGNTNVSIQMIASAIRSRVLGLEFNEVRRRDASMTDKEIARKNMTRATRMRKERCRWEFQMRQVCFYHIEKLIKIGALTEPDMTVLDIYAPIMINTLEKQGVKTPIRDMSKLQGLVRHLTIRHGLHLLYKVPNAPFVNKSFDVMQLKNIDPYMTATQEIVWFSILLLSDQYVDPNRQVVLSALRTLVESRMQTPMIFERFRRGVGGSTATATGAAVPRERQNTLPLPGQGGGYGRPTYRNPGRQVQRPQTGGFAAGGGGGEASDQSEPQVAPRVPPATWTNVQPSDVRYDFNRVLLRISLQQLTCEVEAVLASQKGQRLDREQIGRQLHQLSRDVVMAKPFLPNNKFNGRLSESSLPVFEDKTEKDSPSPILEVASNENIVTIHSLPLFASATDKMQLVIDNCIDRFTKRRKILVGLPYAIDLPHLYKTVDVAPHARRLHCFSMSSSLSLVEMAMIGSEYSDDVADSMARNRLQAHMSAAKNVLYVNIDEYAMERRMEAIDLPREAAKTFSFDLINTKIRTDPKCWVSKERQFDYPSGVVTEKSVTDELNEIRETYEQHTDEEARRKLVNRVVEIHSWFGVDKESTALANKLIEKFGFKSSADPVEVALWEKECKKNRDKRAAVVNGLEAQFKKPVKDAVNPLIAIRETQRLEDAGVGDMTDREIMSGAAVVQRANVVDVPGLNVVADDDEYGNGLYVSDNDNADPGREFDDDTLDTTTYRSSASARYDDDNVTEL